MKKRIEPQKTENEDAKNTERQAMIHNVCTKKSNNKKTLPN